MYNKNRKNLINTGIIFLIALIGISLLIPVLNGNLKFTSSLEPLEHNAEDNFLCTSDFLKYIYILVL